MKLDGRPTYASVNVSHFRHNVKQLVARAGGDRDRVIAVIKANAYGHGAPMLARVLENLGIKKLGVATFEEGMQLREQGIKVDIFVFDGVMGPAADYLSNRLYPVVASMDQLECLNGYANEENRELKLAIKIDTGMGRLGFSPAQADALASVFRQNQFLSLQMVMTHLAAADTPNEEHTTRQYTLFSRLRDIFNERGIACDNYSICNSAALIDERFADFQAVRPGIALYGCYPHSRQNESIALKPVLSLKTKILTIKTMSPGSPIGYGATFVTDKESRIAILPIGYADGYPRLVSNRGHVLVRGQKAAVVGRVSMDLTAIDVTGIADCQIGDDVTLIGQDGDSLIRAEDVAAWADSISYEVLCGLSARVPRVYEGL